MTNSKKILVVAPNFVPDASIGTQRTLALANHLADCGWNVRVVSLPESAFPNTDAKLFKKLNSNVKVFRFNDVDLLKSFRKQSRGMANNSKAGTERRAQAVAAEMPENYSRVSSRAMRWLWPLYIPDKKLQWALALVMNRQMRQLVRDSDCIYTTSPPQSVHIVGALLKKMSKVPWVADLRDPWSDNQLRAFPNDISRRYDGRLEQSVLGLADHVIANTPYFRKLLQERYPTRAASICSIPNGYESALFTSDGCIGATDSNRLKISHLGSLYGQRDIAPLLKGLSLIKKDHLAVFQDIYFEFVGPGTAKFAELVKEYELEEHVLLGSSVPYEEAVQKDRAASVLLCLPLTPEDMYSQVPAKLYQFIALGKPVLAFAAPDGAMAMVLQEAGVDHVMADPRDPVDIARSLLEIHERWKQGVLRYGGNDEMRRRFDRQNMAVQIEQLFRGIFDNDRQP